MTFGSAPCVPIARQGKPLATLQKTLLSGSVARIGSQQLDRTRLALLEHGPADYDLAWLRFFRTFDVPPRYLDDPGIEHQQLDCVYLWLPRLAPAGLNEAHRILWTNTSDPESKKQLLRALRSARGQSATLTQEQQKMEDTCEVVRVEVSVQGIPHPRLHHALSPAARAATATNSSTPRESASSSA